MAVSDMSPASGRIVLSDSEPIIVPTGRRKSKHKKEWRKRVRSRGRMYRRRVRDAQEELGKN
jgi:hypothetical protein